MITEQIRSYLIMNDDYQANSIIALVYRKSLTKTFIYIHRLY